MSLESMLNVQLTFLLVRKQTVAMAISNSGLVPIRFEVWHLVSPFQSKDNCIPMAS